MERGRDIEEKVCPFLSFAPKKKGRWEVDEQEEQRRPRQNEDNSNADTTARAGMDGWGWQGAGPQLWLGNVSCLLARGVINNHLPATGSTEASQGAACAGARAQPGVQESYILGPALPPYCETWASHLTFLGFW